MSQPSIADALERASADLDTIIQEMRLGRPTVARLEELEERAQRVAHDVIAPFRGEETATRTVRGRNGGIWAF